MKIKNKIRPAFTLIEILIATSIFSLLMVMTSGIVAESSGYQAKIKALRNVSAETRKAADFISNEIRSANGSGTVEYVNSAGLKSVSYSTSLAIFNCNQTYCDPQYRTTADITTPGFALPDHSNLTGNVLITFVKEDGIARAHVIAFRDNNQHKLYFKKVSADLNINSEVGSMSEDDVYSGKEESDGTGVEMAAHFGGFAPGKEDLHPRHSYVTFLVTARTRGYDDLPSVQRAIASIRSMVVMRSY